MVFGQGAGRAGLGLRALDAEAGEVVEVGAVWTFEVLLLVVDVLAEADAVQELDVDDVGLLRHSGFSLYGLLCLDLVNHLLIVLFLLYFVARGLR